MGCVIDGRFTVEIQNGVSNGCGEVGLWNDGGGAIEDAVKVLLEGLGKVIWDSSYDLNQQVAELYQILRLWDSNCIES